MHPSKRGRVKEKKDVKRLGGVAQINSGTFWFSKGDFKVNGFLVDSKSSIKGFGVNEKIWDKLRKQAVKEDSSPVFLIGCGKFNQITKTHEHDLVLMDANEWGNLYRNRFQNLRSPDNLNNILTYILIKNDVLENNLNLEDKMLMPILGMRLGRFDLALMTLDTFKEWCLEKGGEENEKN